jgi:hypothetical protein
MSIELRIPNFLLAVSPYDPAHPFHHIYSPNYMSFVLVFSEDDKDRMLDDDIHASHKRKEFLYNGKKYTLVFIQNNIKEACEWPFNAKITEMQFLDYAWEWYKEFLDKYEIDDFI